MTISLKDIENTLEKTIIPLLREILEKNNEASTKEIVETTAAKIISEMKKCSCNKEIAETSEEGQKRGWKRKGGFYPGTSEFKINPEPFGSNILFLDCTIDKKGRKQLIDVWAKEISLIIQIEVEKYDDQATTLLLLDHKTTGIANTVLKETKWVPTLSPVTVDTPGNHGLARARELT